MEIEVAVDAPEDPWGLPRSVAAPDWSVSDQPPMLLPKHIGSLHELWTFTDEKSANRKRYGPLLVWIKPEGESVQVSGSLAGLNALTAAILEGMDKNGVQISEQTIMLRMFRLYTKHYPYTTTPVPALHGSEREQWFDKLRTQVDADTFNKLRPLIQDYRVNHTETNWSVSFGLVTPAGGIEIVEMEGTYAPLVFGKYSSRMVAGEGSVPRFPFEPVFLDEVQSPEAPKIK